MHRTLILLVFILASVGCGDIAVRVPNDDYCADVIEEGRKLAADVRSFEGDRWVFEHTLEAGTLQIEVTVEDALTRAAPTPRPWLDRATDLLVPSAYAACIGPYTDASVTYTVVWSPTAGDTATLHSSVTSNGRFTQWNGGRPYEAPDGREISVRDSGVSFTLVVSSDGDPMAIYSFKDDAAPEEAAVDSAGWRSGTY
jgi:hypothetical protein